jgi:hypothetical protein
MTLKEVHNIRVSKELLILAILYIQATINYAASSSNPISAYTANWASISTYTWSATAFIYNGQLYFNTSNEPNYGYILMIKGSTSGVVGTWIADYYMSSFAPPYEEFETVFTNDGRSTSNIYGGNAFSSMTLKNSATSTYSVSNGVMAITSENTTSHACYAIIGQFLVFGDSVSESDAAYVKQ